MEIIDKYGYLEQSLEFIEKNLVSGKGLRKIAKKARIDAKFLEKFCVFLKGFSEKQFYTLLQEKLENKHSSLLGAVAEISGTDVSIENDKEAIFIFLLILCDIVVDSELEEKVEVKAKIFSKNKIEVKV